MKLFLKLWSQRLAVLGASSLLQLSPTSCTSYTNGNEDSQQRSIREGAIMESVTKDKGKTSGTCDTMTPDMRELHQLISDNSVDLAIELVGRRSLEELNIQNGDGYLLLSLAAKVVPSSRAELLVDALFNAGVSIYVLKYNIWSKRNDLFVACDIGVHPIIFDALLKQSEKEGTLYTTWWTDRKNFYYKANGGEQGYFHLACLSGNYDLVEHLLDIISREGSVRDLLDGDHNNIIEILEITLRCRSEDYNIQLIRLCRGYFDDFPNGYLKNYCLCSYMDAGNDFYDHYNLHKVIGRALERDMQSFVLEFANLYPSQQLNRIIWKWTIWYSDTVLHPRLKLRALAYTPSVEEEEAEHAKARRNNFDFFQFFHSEE